MRERAAITQHPEDLHREDCELVNSVQVSKDSPGKFRRSEVAPAPHPSPRCQMSSGQSWAPPPLARGRKTPAGSLHTSHYRVDVSSGPATQGAEQ
ncbi:hypothetical protein E2C01_083246 [Portunus trituberculatus]|uniref:Uncharacterized protein n=1 Tax=Portunus trituberculatus TaxID=210409 RepID=A0A5B7J7A4_PORTR|nr:hypothetical protein [Portunus trituberculatus]